jgi:hypothetical protein
MTKSAKPRSERQRIRDMMASYGSAGRYGDWLSALLADEDHPERPAKVYKLMSEDARRYESVRGTIEADRLMAEAVKLWPPIVDWTGRD